MGEKSCELGLTRKECEREWECEDPYGQHQARDCPHFKPRPEVEKR